MLAGKTIVFVVSGNAVPDSDGSELITSTPGILANDYTSALNAVHAAIEEQQHLTECEVLRDRLQGRTRRTITVICKNNYLTVHGAVRRHIRDIKQDDVVAEPDQSETPARHPDWVTDRARDAEIG